MKDEILNIIYEKLPMSKKKIENFFLRNNTAEEELIEFLYMYKSFMEKEKISNVDLANAYLEMLDQIIYSRKEFLTTGKYPTSTQKEAYDHTYNNERFMTNYLLGIALSLFIWEHHYLMHSFYKEVLAQNTEKKNFLEVGSGHGLFLLEMLNIINPTNNIDVVDISSTSLKITKSIISTVKPEKINNINFIESDINLYKTDKKYDFITMGEVLEHVDNPLSILKSLHSLLSDDGELFVTTCANCPIIDHVYLFNNIDEIKDLINKAGFRIKNEKIIPTENKSAKYLERYKVDISYAATLQKA